MIIRSYNLLLSLVMLLFTISCSDINVKKEFSNYSSKASTKTLEIEGILLFDSKGFKNINSIPEELKRIKRGAILFDQTNITIISSVIFDSFDFATNSIIKKMDVMNLIFSNFIIFNDGKDSNEEFLKNVNFDNKFYYDVFKFDRSYIITIKEEVQKKYKVISIYTTEDELLESFITSVWEDNCWSKSVNVNITEKFIRLITSNYNSIKNARKWVN